MTAIDEYLRELEALLRQRRLPHRRLVLEVEAHLRDAARESDALEAIGSFGSAEALATRYAEVARPRLARRTLAAAAAASTGLVGVAVAFVAAAPALVRDFPQGAPMSLLVPLAFAALAAAAYHFRARAFETMARCCFAAALAVALAALAETALAVARPAGFILWSSAPWLMAGLAVAGAVAAAAALTAVQELRRERFSPGA